MGKTSKSKKKLKLENNLLKTLQNDIDEEEILSDNITIAINVLDAFFRRLDIYENKQYKLLRKAMFPLLDTQRCKYFDPPLIKVALTDTALFDIIQEHNISTTIMVINYFYTNIDKFYGDINKPFRRALHPFVTYTFSEKESSIPTLYNQATIISVQPLDNIDSNTTLLSNKIVNNIYCDSSNNWKQANNYVSECFRNRNFPNALLALHQVAIQYHASSNKNLLKLGSLQRWVRECDVTEQEDISLLLLHAVLNVIHLKQSDTSNSCNNSNDTFIMNNININNIDNNNNNFHRNSLLIPSNTIISRKRTFHENNTLSHYPFTKIIKTYHPIFQVFKAYPTDAYYSHEYIKASISIASRELLNNNSESIAYEHLNESTNTSLGTCRYKELITYNNFKENLKIVSHVPGLQRRPVSEYDLNIYMTKPFTIKFCENHTTNVLSFDNNKTNIISISNDDILINNNNNVVTKVEYKDNSLQTTFPSQYDSTNNNTTHPVVPLKHIIHSVSGTFLLTGILTPCECLQFILAAERIGYSPDAVDGIDNIVWLADDSILNTIYSRVKELLPPYMDGCKLANNGLNARFRLFRYYTGAIYRPHIDGSWPGSGLLADGSFTNDAYIDQHSKLTFLMYLNDDFTGGSTTFFMPGTDQLENKEENSSSSNDALAGYIDVYEVKPQVGSVLIFPHGSALGSLIHEGSSVLEGVKYVIRTDVLYSKCNTTLS